MGTANAVIGLYNDFPHHWFCQFKRVKDFILLLPNQSEYLSPARKYDWAPRGAASMCGLCTSDLEQPGRFEKAQGVHAQVKARATAPVTRR